MGIKGRSVRLIDEPFSALDTNAIRDAADLIISSMKDSPILIVSPLTGPR